MKALLIIPPARFRDEEYFYTKEELEKATIGTITASKYPEEAVGMLGARVKPGKTFSEIDLKAYDAIVFIGGGGAATYFKDPTALELAKKADAAGKVVAAICIAPTILANAGLLKGKKVTAFESEKCNMESKGAKWTGERLTVDGRIITASGPEAAREFGKAIAKALGK